MTPDPATERDERLRYLELTQADRALLAELAGHLLPHLEGLLESWHGFLRGHPGTAPLLLDSAHRGHLLEVQRGYFESLLTGERDAAYFAQRSWVGRVHHRVGLAPFWYLGAYRKFISLALEKLRVLGHGDEPVARWSAALEKVVALDVALALDAYQAQAQEALRRSNRDLEDQMQQTREASRLKEAFLQHISHELRTPLHAMLGFADLVADGIQGPVTEQQRDSLAKVRLHGERLVAMVDQLIEAAKLSAAAENPPQPFDPTPLIEEAAAAAADAAAHKGLGFTCELDRPLAQVLGDRHGTAVALRQLLDNAVRFTPAGTVALRAGQVEGRVRIEVTDSGPGIPPGETTEIFKPFYRLPGSGSGSVGMGLTLAKEALRIGGGTLELERTDATGTTFTVELPVAVAEGT